MSVANPAPTRKPSLLKILFLRSFAEQITQRRSVPDGSVSAGLSVWLGTAGFGANGKGNRCRGSQRP